MFLCYELEQIDNNNLLTKWFQWFTGIVLQGFFCFCFVIILSMSTCFWSTITSGITHCCLSSIHLILRQYQQNNNSNLLAEWFQWNTVIVLQVNGCYCFIDMSQRQRNTGIILTTKHWNYSTCFGPKCKKMIFILFHLMSSLKSLPKWHPGSWIRGL